MWKQNQLIITNRHITYMQCVRKNKSTYFLAWQCHQTADKHSNFLHRNLSNSCNSGYDYVVHLACIMPVPGITFQTSYILALHKTIKQYNNRNLQSINFTHWTMKLNPSQNVYLEPIHNVFIFSGKWHFKMTLQYYVSGKGFVWNATAVVSWVDSGLSPPNFIKFSSVLTEFMAKILWLFVFLCGHGRYTVL